mgnify:CR=1 FL=1|tara:strand:+ start:958 stop:2676 length:1719 start_codon:yes stop_codon:yes gene_type:complete
MNRDIYLWTCAASVGISLILSTTLVVADQPTKTHSPVQAKTLVSTIDPATWNPRSLVVSTNIQSVAYIQKASDTQVQVVRNGKPGALFDTIKHDSLQFSPDGQRLAYQATKGKHQVIVVDELVSAGYRKILDGSFTFSPNGSRYAYAAQNKKRQWFAVVDGELSSPYRRIVPYSLQFSPITNRVAYIANAGAKQVMVMDGQVSPHYDNIWIGESLFDSTGTRTAYVTQTGKTWAVIVDGDEGPHVDFITVTSLIFSKDGQHTAYIAQSGDKWVAVYDNTFGPPHAKIRGQSLAFNPKGTHLAYSAKDGNTWTSIVDNKKVGISYDDIDGIQPTYSPDGTQIAFGVRIGPQWGVVVDGALGIPHTDIGHDSFRFSSNSQHFAYIANLEGMWFVVQDGQPSQIIYGRTAQKDLAFSRVGIQGPVFSPNGKRLAYSVTQGVDKSGVVLDGQLGRPHWSLIEESLLFSPDSSKLSYVAESADRKWRVFIERNVSGQAYDGIGAHGVTFSADSAHELFYGLRDRKWMVVIDGRESEQFDSLLSGKNGPLHLNTSNELRYIGRQHNEIYLVETKVGAV